MHLLDINILLALGDPHHVHHARTRVWFLAIANEGWVTCPITENGFVRILGQSSYPGFEGNIDDARQMLEALVSFPRHQFWPDDLSILDMGVLPKLRSPKHLTDLYLLALAIKKKGKFATLDERIDPEVVPGGKHSLVLIS
jgi:uncharacterized protein